MKSTVLKGSFLCLMMFSVSPLADEIIDAGKSVVLEKRDKIYMLPTTYTI